MDKIAKTRGVYNKIKEKTNVSGIAAEKYFAPELMRVMDALRKCDNNIRSVALGKSIEGGDFGSTPTSLKVLLKAITSNLNRREFMLALAELSTFHKKMFEINALLKKFDLDTNKIHYQFLFKGLGEGALDKIKDLDTQRWKVEAADKINFVRYAGLSDIIHNITNSRGRALAAWEKRYPKLIGTLKDKSIEMLNKSNVLFDNLNNYFDQFANARAERDTAGYEAIAKNFNKEFAKYDSDFRVYYNGTVKPFVDQAKLFEEAEKSEQINQFNEQNALPMQPMQPILPKSSPTLPSNVNVPVTQPPAAIRQFPAPEFADSSSGLSSNSPLSGEAVKEVSLNDIKSDDFEPIKSAKFISTLESMADEDSSILCSYIKKYAKSIQEKYPKQAIELLKIVVDIKK